MIIRRPRRSGRLWTVPRLAGSLVGCVVSWLSGPTAGVLGWLCLVCRVGCNNATASHQHLDTLDKNGEY